MFDIGFLEMVVMAVVALLVLGPEKLPGAVRMAGLYMGRIKRSLAEVRSQVEREIGADELRQTLHNEKIMADLAKKPGTSNVKRRNQDADEEEPAAGTSPAAPAAAPETGSSEAGSPPPSNDDQTPRP
ncbi:Sec-independent protein translocase protein TatB [Halopseudomonas pertucinogena]|uniref:Sec-independent protein translocase protein TatB n=1 Tax=Halopseudomonas pertucinogena TaxID=86175 RepID=A0ABQ2CQ74_9GAMM|nr:Sec-independent protein translocase protein TatB [Halopseudomonas pertucinogena]GGJ02250.1 sec-independent protein translocase protein TatB [Halopseudomonas pertucinogena]